MATLTSPPRSVVSGPARAPLPFGLFSVVAFRPGSADRWATGVTWETDSCADADGYGGDACSADPPNPFTDLAASDCSLGVATPFAVFASFVGSPFGADHEARATAALAAHEQKRVEQALQTGDLDNTPYLNDTSTTHVIDTGGVGLDLAEGLAVLEAYIATEYGSVGTIHLSRKLASLATVDGKVKPSGGRLTTQLGTPVVAGAGYDGSAGPGGAAAPEGSEWAYVTPALFGYQSAVQMVGSDPDTGTLLFDTGTNDVYAVAQRDYLIGYDDCGVGAVLVSTATSTGGGGVGPAGKSAYEIAVDNGFEGTETEWLASLVGPKGDAATVTVGTTSTLSAGSDATVTNSGTDTDAVLDFGVPKGATGSKGTKGDPGVVQTVAAGDGIAVDSTDPANPVVSSTATP